VSTAVEFLVVAMVVRVQTADVCTRVVGVRRRLTRIARAASEIVSGAAVLPYVVVAPTVEEVTAKQRVAQRRVVARRVGFVALAVNEVLAVCRRVVTAAYNTFTDDATLTVSQNNRNATINIT